MATKSLITGLAPSKSYKVAVSYRHAEKYSARQVIDVTTPADLEATLAAAIEGQGALATLNSVTASVLAAGIGKNCIFDGDFRFALGSGSYWNASAQSGTPTGTIETGTPVRHVKNVGASVTVGHYIHITAFNKRALFPCKAGDKIEASAFIAGASLSSSFISVQWCNSSLGYISENVAGSGGASPGAGTGDLTTFTRAGGIVTAPANTCFASVVVYGQASTSTPTLRVALPMIAQAGSNQTELSPWNIGFSGEPGADVTLAHTAAAIISQGALATLNTVNTAQIAAGAVSQAAAATASGAVSFDNSGSTDLQSVTLTTTGGAVLVTFSAEISVIESTTLNNTTEGDTVLISIYRDATLLVSFRCCPLVYFQHTAKFQNYEAVSFSWIDLSPTAASHTYKATAISQSSAATTIGNAVTRTVTALELKR